MTQAMHDSQEIEAQAAAWLIKRDAAGGEDVDLRSWLASDPRHRAAYLRLAAAWERTSAMKRLRPDGESIDADLLSPKPKRKHLLWSWTPLAIAASAAIVTLAAVWWLSQDHGFQTYRTDVGGLSRVVLADGSTVTLNTDTEVRVHLLPQRREISLLRGEAQFAVAHDANRPFEVSAGGRIVRAVGTAFDVRLSPDQAVQVIVTEGRVAVEDSGEQSTEGVSAATVSAGESAIAQGPKVTVKQVGTTEASRRLAWEVGELSFQGETLKEAIAEFNRYNHRKLKVADPAIADLQVGGNFQALDLDSFVAALARSFNVTGKTLADGSILLERPANSAH